MSDGCSFSLFLFSSGCSSAVVCVLYWYCLCHRWWNFSCSYSSAVYLVCMCCCLCTSWLFVVSISWYYCAPLQSLVLVSEFVVWLPCWNGPFYLSLLLLVMSFWEFSSSHISYCISFVIGFSFVVTFFLSELLSLPVPNSWRTKKFDLLPLHLFRSF